MTASPSRSFAQIVRTLTRAYGAASKPVSRDPFHLVLYEQVGYLVPDAQRRAAFSRLRREVGLAPAAILDASTSTLEAIARAGGAIGASLRAARMQESAELVISKWEGALRGALQLPVEKARSALAAFPMIGRPGADRILAATGAHAVLGLDSNALRVLLRLGWGKEQRQYAASYRSVLAAIAPELPKQTEQLAAAAEVLRRHGQELCRRSTPVCGACPVAPMCTYARRASRGD